MSRESLESFLSGLDVGLEAFALCEIGSDWRLNVPPLDRVVCHFVLEGGGYLEFAGRREPITAGTMVVVPAGTAKSITGAEPVTHEVSASESCEDGPNGLLLFRARSDQADLILGCVTLSAASADGRELFAGLREPLLTSLGENPHFASSFDALVQELTEPKLGAMVVAECLLKEALVLLLREQSGGEPAWLHQFGDQRTHRAAAAMTDAPSAPHRVASLAELSGMSRSSFVTHFVREHGKPPGEYLQNVRMHSAARLLLTTELPIKCIAAEVGYASRSQFSRAFKLAYDADPTAYRTLYSPEAPGARDTELDSDIFITRALASRPARCHDPRRENVALQELAGHMAEDPSALLPHFVDLAMRLTDSSSAGLSIFDAEVAPDVFQWRCLRGLLSPFEQATTPRNNSPCGVTLDAKQPMLLRHPERIYDWVAAENLVVPEVLLVPLYVAAEPLGTLWVVASEEGHFRKGDARILSELSSFVGIALKMLRSGGSLETALAA